MARVCSFLAGRRSLGGVLWDDIDDCVVHEPAEHTALYLFPVLMGMREFAKTALLFVAGCAVVFGFLSVIYTARVSNRDNFYDLLKRFENPGVQPGVLILGDSRPAFAVRHKFTGGDIYNFSFPSETYREMLLKAEYALEAKPHIRYLVIPTDYHMLSSFYAADKDATHLFALASAADIRSAYEFSLGELALSVLHAYVPLTDPAAWAAFLVVIKKDIRSLFSGKVEKRTVAITPDGNLVPTDEASWSEFSPTAKAARADRRIASHFPRSGPVVTDEMVRALDRLLLFARERGIGVIGVRFPVTAEYETRMREVGLDGVDAVLRERNSKFVARLDYTRWSREREDFFQDADHLNSLGAEAFTRQFDADIRSVIK